MTMHGAVALIGAFLLYGASFVLVFPFSSTICTGTSQAVVRLPIQRL